MAQLGAAVGRRGGGGQAGASVTSAGAEGRREGEGCYKDTTVVGLALLHHAAGHHQHHNQSIDNDDDDDDERGDR